ncbi:MAG: general secretion pathway protein GspN [Leptothrix sp. (in: Bacteria)]|nr:general secretion pathway protein GspN [Leptothrix sp. (in: b-proteobacteria)]
MRLWALLGAAVGALAALVAFAPAAWLAGAVTQATGERLLLAEARGTVWQGSAVVVLTGGSGSRDASALPGRLHWRLGLDGAALALRARQACCLNGEVLLRVLPGLGRLRLELPPAPAATVVGQWPASWLVGLGTPWNTLQPEGTLQLSSPGLWLEQVQGRWRFGGRAELLLGSMASRLSTLDTLGSYRLSLAGDAASQAATLRLGTVSGALQLSGSGQLLGGDAASWLRFRGQASAEAGSEAVLDNLLNIIGRRQGAVSVISIG